MLSADERVSWGAADGASDSLQPFSKLSVQAAKVRKAPGPIRLIPGRRRPKACVDVSSDCILLMTILPAKRRKRRLDIEPPSPPKGPPYGHVLDVPITISIVRNASQSSARNAGELCVAYGPDLATAAAPSTPPPRATAAPLVRRCERGWVAHFTERNRVPPDAASSLKSPAAMPLGTRARANALRPGPATGLVQASCAVAAIC